MRIFLIVLLLSLGLYATETSAIQNDTEELGTPYMISQSGWISSAVLMPDGKGFYTYQNGKVTIWKLNPIKPIDSFVIEENARSRQPFRESIHVSSDNKRLIFHSTKGIQLWDLEKRMLIKKIKGETKWWLASNSNYGFVTLDYDSQLTLWDDKTLTILKQKKLPRNQKYDRENRDPRYPAMNKLIGDNILFVNYLFEAYFFDLKTLEVVDTLNDNSFERNSRHQVIEKAWDKIKHEHIQKHALDFVTIRESRIVYFDKYKDKFDPAIWETYMKHIWAHNTYSTISTCTSDKVFTLALYKLDDKKMYILEVSKFDFEQKEVHRFKIWQRNNAWYVEDKNHYFNASKNTREFLKMKNKEGISVPMNDSTFNHYKNEFNIEVI